MHEIQKKFLIICPEVQLHQIKVYREKSKFSTDKIDSTSYSYIFLMLEKNSEFPTFCLITFLTIFTVFYGLPGFQKILFEIILNKGAS